MHCGVEVTESSTNKQHHLSDFVPVKLFHAGRGFLRGYPAASGDSGDSTRPKTPSCQREAGAAVPREPLPIWED